MSSLNKILLLVVFVLGGIYAFILRGHGESGHGSVIRHEKHDHILFDKVLGVDANQISSIIVAYEETDQWLILSDKGWSVSNVTSGCNVLWEYGMQDNIRSVSPMKSGADTTHFTRNRTFLSMMMPDAEIPLSQQSESYGLEQPVGCILVEIGMDDNKRVVFLEFGDFTPQNFNQYLRKNSEDTVLLIPRYFWPEMQKMLAEINSAS